MILFGISPQAVRQYKNIVAGRGRLLMGAFLASCALPFVIYALFAFDLISARPRFNRDMEAPVAMVQTSSGLGTAFLYDETSLFTARHVVEGMQVGDEVSLIFQNAEPVITTTATIAWVNPDQSSEGEINYYLHDVARLELAVPGDLPEDFPRLVIGDSEGVTTRTPVVLVGYPGGSPSTTTGTISSEEVQGADIFQLDVAAYPGNSGGPLMLEDTEEVIGILIAGKTGVFQGINFAIKVNNVDLAQ